MSTPTEPHEQLRLAFLDAEGQLPALDLDRLWHETLQRHEQAPPDPSLHDPRRNRRRAIARTILVAATAASVVGVLALRNGQPDSQGPASADLPQLSARMLDLPPAEPVRGPVSADWACARTMQYSGASNVSTRKPWRIPRDAGPSRVARMQTVRGGDGAVSLRFGDAAGELTAIIDLHRDGRRYLVDRHVICDVRDDAEQMTESPELLLVRSADSPTYGMGDSEPLIIDSRPTATRYGTIAIQTTEVRISCEPNDAGPCETMLLVHAPASSFASLSRFPGDEPRCSPLAIEPYVLDAPGACIFMSPQPVDSIRGTDADGNQLDFSRVELPSRADDLQVWAAITGTEAKTLGEVEVTYRDGSVSRWD